MFTDPWIDDAFCAVDKAYTYRWEITRTRDLYSTRSTDYTWREEGHTEAAHLEHTLRVTSTAGGYITGLVLDCKPSAERAYKITYRIQHLCRARLIDLSCPQSSSAGQDAERVSTGDEASPELEEVLRCIPPEIAQSTYHGLASV